MLIKVESDFVDKVLVSKEEKLIDVLHRLLWALHFGKHAVFFNTKDYNKLLTFEELSPMEKGTLKKVLRHNYDMASFSKNVDIICHVTFNAGSSSKDENDIYINPYDAGEFEFQTETHIITENFSDSKFFIKYIVPYYQRINKTKGISLCLFRIMGFGNNMKQVMEQEVNLKHHFALAITDSDKEYPKHNKIGDTTKNVDYALKNNPFNCDHYVMKDVMEVENLLPFKYITENPKLNCKDIVSNKYTLKDYSFFDMKKGLVVSDSSEFNNYWEDNITDEEIKTQYHEAVSSKSMKQIIEGLGDHVFTDTMKYMEDHHAMMEEGALSPSQTKVWNEIAKSIISWCCCFAKMRS